MSQSIKFLAAFLAASLVFLSVQAAAVMHANNPSGSTIQDFPLAVCDETDMADNSGIITRFLSIGHIEVNNCTVGIYGGTVEYNGPAGRVIVDNPASDCTVNVNEGTVTVSKGTVILGDSAKPLSQTVQPNTKAKYT